MTHPTPALSIDTPEFRIVLENWAGALHSSDHRTRTVYAKQAYNALIAHINAALSAASQGAQQAEPVGFKKLDLTDYSKPVTYSNGTGNLAAPAATAAPKVPEGFALVPLKVTPEMRAAWDRAPQGEDDDKNFFDAYNAMLNASPVPMAEWDLDDYAVQAFAGAMRSKMAKSRAKGRGGWEDPEQCPTQRLQLMLLEHLKKGDPVDVANFCMMLWTRGEPVVEVDLKAARRAALEDAAAICDNFAKRDMHPAECAGAIHMMKDSIK